MATLLALCLSLFIGSTSNPIALGEDRAQPAPATRSATSAAREHHPDANCALKVKVCLTGNPSFGCTPSDCSGLGASFICKEISIPSATPGKKIYWCECTTGSTPGAGHTANCTLIYDAGGGPAGQGLVWCFADAPYCASSDCLLCTDIDATCVTYFCKCGPCN